ncbi:hypothetical protein PsorP6_011793 [Peronosclerospora sorghi]|uniref:Uncharacterized protein n=1 Tax=Peronosclerospora sorghi TaxID=230839 RepID=A0ACC0WII5_9STRA|nr:hypothetical protein PsorP6_011793 [Peronosclerospora sorghi]
MEVARIGKLYTTVVETANQERGSRGVLNIEQEREAELIGKPCDGLPKRLFAPVNNMSLCDGCLRGKMISNKFSANVRGHVKTTEVLQLVHTDLTGHMRF